MMESDIDVYESELIATPQHAAGMWCIVYGMSLGTVDGQFIVAS